MFGKIVTILTLVHETDNLWENHVSLVPFSAPNGICRDPPHLNENNQSEPRIV